MIYQAPALTAADAEVLELIRLQAEILYPMIRREPRQWWGSLRRALAARAVQGSNSIEGYHATLDEINAIEMGGRVPEEGREKTLAAIAGYRRAMTHLIRTAEAGIKGFDTQFLKSVHFMMIEHDLNKNPGHWRTHPIYVHNKNGDVVYEGVAAEKIGQSMNALVETLCVPDMNQPLLVRAAMAHLNMAMIHPFSDGNGRMARALQSFVLAREATANPIFSSIEEWLGNNTQEYYQILGQMSDGTYAPQTDTTPWIRFCFKAHYQQMQIVLQRSNHMMLFSDQLEKQMKEMGLPRRCFVPLLNAAQGFSLTRVSYEKEAEVSAGIATRDLQLLTQKGFLDAQGEKRGRRYCASEKLQNLAKTTRPPKPLGDPYEQIASKKEGGFF